MTIERISPRNQAGFAWHARFLLLACALWLAIAGGAQAADILNTVIERKQNREFVIFHLSSPVEHKKVFLLKDPDRLVVDLERVRGDGATMPRNTMPVTVRNIRFGQFNSTTSRIVIDLTMPVKQASLHHFTAQGGQPHRVVVELEPLKGLGAMVEQARRDYPAPVQKAPPPKPAKPIIVIDAGHGGKDPGARGVKGSREKDITLRYALALRKALLRTGRYDVVMTRETDEFILLHERVKIGQRAKGSAFISLHADSAPGSKTARGLSVYTLSEKASDAEAAALAAKENQADVIDGLDLGAEVDKEVATILIDLAQRETKNKSSRLADVMVQQFGQQGIRLLKNTHRYAGFRVLKAPDVPSVLIETGFLSHPDEEALVKTEAYQQKVIQGIIYALDKFFEV